VVDNIPVHGHRADMRLLSRALFAVGVAGLLAVVLRLRGSGGTPPRRGGWRELSASDLGPVDES